MPQPTFIIIGAMKSGTSSLHEYLATHPEVSVSSLKETDYFITRDKERDWSWYTSLFDSRARAVGEASPNYTKRHAWPEAAGRIAETLPEVKLIYIVRDPVKRVLSHYIHNYAKGRERGTFAEAIRKKSHYLQTSMYGYQLESYLQHFPKERVLVVESEKLRRDTDATLRRVFEHIGVQADFNVPIAETTFHASADKLRWPTLERRVRGRHLRRAIRPFLPARLTEPQPFERPVPTRDDLDYLADVLQPDIERFRALTGESFLEWPLQHPCSSTHNRDLSLSIPKYL